MNQNALIETIPNFSEGRRTDVIEEIISAVRETEGISILDYSSDPDHNRTVLTMAGNPESVKNAVYKLYEMASRHIDLTEHEGEHPRMGAVDVVPFVPLRDATMDECVELSKEVAQKVASEYGVPIILYEESASAKHRKNLAKVRKGQFEGMGDKLKEEDWKPDFGDAQPHPKLGVSAIGARMPLIAFNVNLDTNNLDIASQIARNVRHLSGGLRFVKALGMDIEDRPITQVSMNLVNFKKTPIYRAVELIRIEARRYGVNVVGSEIIGLIPMEAIAESFAYYIGLENYDFNQILETKLQ